MADQSLGISRPNLYQPLFQGLQEVGHLSVLLDAADHRSVDVVKVGIRRFPCRHFNGMELLRGSVQASQPLFPGSYLGRG